MIDDVRKTMSWRAVLIAGIAAATVFLLVNLVLTPAVLEVQPGLIFRYFGGLVLGNEVVLTPSNPTAVAVGIVVIYVLSFLYAFVIAFVFHRWGLIVGLIGGAILGLSFYAINMYVLTSFFEWFFAIHSPVLLLAHVLFGATAGGVYELFDHFDIVSHQTPRRVTRDPAQPVR